MESYAARQTKLWKVLSKYHHLLDHFHDLQTTLQTKFSLLKKATSQNIENLQEAITLQQTYTSALCGHINSIYAKLVQLDKQVQTHCLYTQPKSDVVQINAPKYDSDIDGQTDLLPDIQPSTALHTGSTAENSLNAGNIQEDTVSVAANSEGHSASSQDSDRLESQSPPVLDNTDHSAYQDTEQPREEYPNYYRPELEDIPELEDDKENWEEGQFVDADFIDHHNTTEESDQICCEYSEHFEKVTNQRYSSHNSRTPGLEYHIPEPEYCNSDTRPKQYQRYQNPNIYLPPLPSTEDLC